MSQQPCTLILCVQNSGNGVFVKGSRIDAKVPHKLHHQDSIELARDPITNVAQYKFTYYTKARIPTALPDVLPESVAP